MPHSPVRGQARVSNMKILTIAPCSCIKPSAILVTAKENEKCLMIETNRGDHVRLEIWDTAGQERNASLVAQ